MRNEKGITLIALILIIVLFLVLAVISVMLVINGEKEESNTNTLVYDQQVFEDAYNEYTNTAVEDEGNVETTNTTENESDANVVDTNTVTNPETEATNTVTNEI